LANADGEQKDFEWEPVVLGESEESHVGVLGWTEGFKKSSGRIGKGIYMCDLLYYC
jgi:hypothetical protein